MRKALCAVPALMILLCLALPVWGGPVRSDAALASRSRSLPGVRDSGKCDLPGCHPDTRTQDGRVRRM
jgi:hypothetical protein